MKQDSAQELYRELLRRKPGRIRPDLGRIRSCLDAIGRPEKNFRSILIVGTNGKGSTTAMLSSILTASGLRIGSYTSPHLLNVRERIRVDGNMISREALADILRILKDYPDLSFFETLTVTAFEHFSRQKVDLAVLEAGMGGRWDATRSAESAIAGISSLGLDHSAWLGRSIEAIAADKGAALRAADIGIIARGVDEKLLPALGAPAAFRASQLVEIVKADTSQGHEARYRDGRCMSVELPLRGSHQLGNLELALALAEAGASRGWYRRPGETEINRGLRRCSWPGRLSELQLCGHVLLLDGAHNLEAVRVLATELAGTGQRYDLLFSCLEDKPAEAMATLLRPLVKRVALCPLEDQRAMKPEDLIRAWPEGRMAPDPLAALHLLGPRVLATGSLRLVGTLLGAAEMEKHEGVRDVD